ncbi:AAA family ATPase [Streptacidiphilus cavernicola]|uniref:AAA family ATPase n=1 Tax=Streptacidiphilus cavernicola TaxID=3342716 RepID=A0ABV6VNU4_9ACTN
MPAAPPALKLRQPTGIVPWPLILIEGEESAGKTYSAAQFSASERIGQTYWIDLSEGSADEYAAIPGARYMIIDHDGSYRDIVEQLRAVHAEARRAALAGEPPVVVVVDSASALWQMLKTWTTERARRSGRNAAKLQADPDDTFDIGMNLWNDATTRWMEVIHLLQTLPGIAIVTARGKQVTAVDEDGRPVVERGKTVKDWRVQGQKDLAFDSSVWVRMFRDSDPQIIKARSLKLRIERGRALTVPDFTIEDLVFNRLGCSTDSQPRQITALVGDRVAQWLEEHDVEHLADVDELRQLWWSCLDPEHRLTRAEVVTIRNTIEQMVDELQNPPTEMGQRTPTDADRLRAAVQARDELPDEPDDEPKPARRSRRAAA